jgi:hypothetical protein
MLLQSNSTEHAVCSICCVLLHSVRRTNKQRGLYSSSSGTERQPCCIYQNLSCSNYITPVVNVGNVGVQRWWNDTAKGKATFFENPHLVWLCLWEIKLYNIGCKCRKCGGPALVKRYCKRKSYIFWKPPLSVTLSMGNQRWTWLGSNPNLCIGIPELWFSAVNTKKELHSIITVTYK